MIYVLLLRGINVGGKNKVSMNDLKKLLFSLILTFLLFNWFNCRKNSN